MKPGIWSIIIWICTGTLAAAVILELLIPKDPDTPTLPRELLIQSQAMRIGLEGETGSGWQDAIAEANTGNADKLIGKVDAAIFAGNFNAACAAAALAQGEKLRDKLFTAIGDRAVEQCRLLPYAVFAVDKMSPGKIRSALADRIAARSDICRKAARRGQ